MNVLVTNLLLLFPLRLDAFTSISHVNHHPRIQKYTYTQTSVMDRKFMKLESNSNFIRINSSLQASKYGRGSEIWPECNVEGGGIDLSDSFPAGWAPKVEPEADTLDLESLTLPFELENQELPLSIVFRQVSKKNKITTIAGFLVLCRGLVRPSDLLFVIAFSGYVAVLTKAKLLGRVPPQGHVPELVRNPLGVMLTRSKSYKKWLQLGAGIGVYAPIAVIVKSLVAGNPSAARAVGRPMFLLCCQVVTEGLMRMRKVPLPLRILVPVAYNTIRIGLIWEHWLMLPYNIGFSNRFLAATNMIYWTLNLFGFLLPVATLRYLRAHFFCIEAEEVVVRLGSEDGVGLLPNVIPPPL